MSARPYDITKTTVKRILPYSIQRTPNGKVWIKNTRGQVLIVDKNQIVRQLERKDLDVHRRRMYEAALAEVESVK